MPYNRGDIITTNLRASQSSKIGLKHVGVYAGDRQVISKQGNGKIILDNLDDSWPLHSLIHHGTEDVYQIALKYLHTEENYNFFLENCEDFAKRCLQEAGLRSDFKVLSQVAGGVLTVVGGGTILAGGIATSSALSTGSTILAIGIASPSLITTSTAVAGGSVLITTEAAAALSLTMGGPLGWTILGVGIAGAGIYTLGKWIID